MYDSAATLLLSGLQRVEVKKMPESGYLVGKDARTGLTRREREVYGLLMGTEDEAPLTQMEVAELLSVSRQRVRQLVEQCARKGFEIPFTKPPNG